jgi:hypothetical protein
MRPSQNWNHVILDTMLFAGAENTNSYRPRGLPFEYLLDLAWVNDNTFYGDDMSKKRNLF